MILIFALLAAHRLVTPPPPPASVESCGMVADGVTDNAPLLNACVAWAKANHLKTLFVPFGGSFYRFTTRPAPIGFGLTLEGEGSTMGGAGGMGNGLDVGGTTFVRDYIETDDSKGFLTWDGSDAPTGGLGGGMRRMRLLAAVGTSGGTAILLTGTDVNHRTGWMVFEDIGVSRVALGGSWHRDLEIDGSLLAAVPGVRDVMLRNCYFFVASDPGKTVVLRYGINVHFAGGGSFVPAGPTAGVWIGEHSAGITFSGIAVSGPGSVTIDDAASIYGNVAVDGGALTITSNASSVNLIVLDTNGATITNAGTRSRVTSTP